MAEEEAKPELQWVVGNPGEFVDFPHEGELRFPPHCAAHCKTTEWK